MAIKISLKEDLSLPKAGYEKYLWSQNWRLLQTEVVQQSNVLLYTQFLYVLKLFKCFFSQNYISNNIHSLTTLKLIAGVCGQNINSIRLKVYNKIILISLNYLNNCRG